MQAKTEMASTDNPIRPKEHSRQPIGHKSAGRIRQSIILIVLTIGAITMIIPFEWMLATSLSRSANIAMPRIPQFWPPDPSFYNYGIAFINLRILRYYWNSFIVTTSTTLGWLLFSSMAGYAFAKGRFPGKSFLFILLLTTLMIPFEIRMVPMYLEMRALHLNDTLLALILPFVAGGFGTFFMRQYMTSIPNELLDAARLDGAGEFTIYFKIVLPLCRPALAALAVLSALWRWNDLLWPLLIISNAKLYTVPLGLAISGSSQGRYVGLMMADTALSILPIVVFYIFMQRFIVRSIMLSGLKG